MGDIGSVALEQGLKGCVGRRKDLSRTPGPEELRVTLQNIR